MNPFVGKQIINKVNDAKKLDAELKHQRVETQFSLFVQEAVNSGLINPVDNFIDQSDYQEIFSRFASMDDQTNKDVLDAENMRIEGI